MDGIHLNSRGAKAVAEAFDDRIAALRGAVSS
jgi:lysophospholipase L1-like esterase